MDLVQLEDDLEVQYQKWATLSNVAHFKFAPLNPGEYIRRAAPMASFIVAALLIQTGPNHLNKYYSWPPVVFIQVVWPSLYIHLGLRGQILYSNQLYIHLGLRGQIWNEPHYSMWLISNIVLLDRLLTEQDPIHRLYN